MIKVLHLTAADHGGAGRAAHRLHLSLRDAGIDSRMCVFDKHSSDKWTTALNVRDSTFAFRRFLTRAVLKVITVHDYHFHSQEFSPGLEARELCGQLGFSPEVVVVHYLSNFLSYQDVLDLQRLTRAPVIWNLLDMGGLTGGCHYAWSCRRYQDNCGNCPALWLRGEYDLSSRTLSRKNRVFSAMDMVVVAGSTLLEQQASQSAIFGKRDIKTILIGIDPETFRQGVRKEARALLGLPVKKRTVLFQAQNSKDQRKGYRWLVEALQHLAEMESFDQESVQILSVGKVSHSRALAAAGYTQEHLGPISDESRLVLAFQAADVLACPSVQDSGPMMINESLMCGTPVVAFEMGVAMDLITPRENGYIARLEDKEDFAKGLHNILDLSESDSVDMSDRCRSIALQKCSAASQARKYLDLITTLHERRVESSDSTIDEAGSTI